MLAFLEELNYEENNINYNSSSRTWCWGLAVTDDAEASEQNIDKQELAEMAQAESEELNNAPLHEGEYHYNFNLDQVDYDFQSDGVNYTWAYNDYTEQSAENTEAPEQTSE